MKKLFPLAAALLCSLAAQAALTTSTIQITNAPADGNTITINTTTRTWKSSVSSPSTQIAIGGSVNACATNLYQQLAANRINGLHLAIIAADTVRLEGDPLSVSATAGYASISSSAATETDSILFRVPLSSEPTASKRTNIASQVVADLGAYSTNAFDAGIPALANYLSLTLAQTIAGAKYFTNAAGEWRGIVSNSPAISGTAVALTNGLYYSPILVSPTFTNAVNYGNAFSSHGTSDQSEQFGNLATANGIAAIALGAFAAANGDAAIAIGEETAADAGSSVIGFQASGGPDCVALGANANAGGDSSVALGANAQALHTNSVAIGTDALTTARDQIRMGSSSQHVSIPGALSVMGNCELTFARAAISSLANGNNADMAVGTNTFCEVSGPSGAFTINGIANGRDGKFLIVVNQTGQNMTIAHDSGVEASAANRIYSMTGADRTTTGNGSALLIYSGAANRWILIGFEQ